MSAHSNPTLENYLLIGGSMPVGECVVDQLLRRNETHVCIFDTTPLLAEQAARFHDAVRVWVDNDLVPESVADAVKSSTIKSNASMALHQKVNTEGMRNVLAAVLENSSITQLLYISTAEIFFDGHDRSMLCEADAPYPLKCHDEHAEPQAQAERMVLSFNGVNALHTAVIRPAMLMGPGLGVEGIMAEMEANPSTIAHQIGNNTNFVDQTYVAQEHQTISLFGGGGWSWERWPRSADQAPLDVANAAHAAILAADRLRPSHPNHAATAGKAFFITDADPRPFRDFSRSLWAAAGGAPVAPVIADTDFVGGLWGANPNWWKKMEFMCTTRTYDISLAKEVLGYAPIVSHDEAIRRMAQGWLQQQRKIYKDKEAVTDPGAEAKLPPKT
ncbi:hypothetical protein B0H19DRAFT_1367495 [Mycena capillaripes]|nr:hypothetical protein B0H19DRAFT_1367495 [Mycena capillaripes]